MDMFIPLDLTFIFQVNLHFLEEEDKEKEEPSGRRGGGGTPAKRRFLWSQLSFRQGIDRCGRA